jgi:serine/threonine protein kinase/tetratricopeptide (TPR) repeat protein
LFDFFSWRVKESSMTRSVADIEAIFFEAQQKQGAERAAYLDKACASDAELRQRVEQFLGAQAEIGSFLEVAAPPVVATVDATLVAERPGTVIGPYKLLEQIGEGGFGIVFMAEQTQPVRRKVALKVLKPGMDTRQVVARFEAERQALALMDHPNIAQVFDGGETASGRPYFVMELVRGIPVTDFCDQNRQTIRQRLELFVKVCQAVQHAHQRGIIHRDLKPSNILVTLHDGTPIVKVIDFGIAKALGQQLTDKTLYTNFAQMIGTPQYMSPEQAEMSGLDMDTRSDIYSLGVLMYELLTGTTPCDKERLRTAAYDDIRRMIREEEPARPSTRLSTLGQAAATVSANRQSDPKRLGQLFRGELDWIVMKALEKDRNRRYETASAFAADVQRYLANEVVFARPSSKWYRFRKFAGRKKGLLAALGLVLLTLIAGILGTTVALVEARAQQKLARAGETQARQSEAETRAVLQFFQKKVLSAAKPKGQVGGLGREATIRAAVDQAEASIAQSFADTPLAEASIRETLGFTYWYLSEYARAIEQQERVLALRRTHLPPDHPDTLKAMASLASAYQAAGRLDDALPLQEETLNLRKAHLGLNDAETLWSMNRVATTLVTLGRLAEALPLEEEGLSRAKIALGPDHHDTLIYMSYLAVGYRQAGRVSEALRLHEEALELHNAKLGPTHPDTLAAMNDFAVTHHEAGRLAEAIALQEKALALRKTVLGPDHSDTLNSMNNLAAVYRDAGRLAEALPLGEHALNLLKTQYGPDHPYALLSMANLATTYREAGRLDEAFALYDETSRLMKTKFGPAYLRRLSVMNDLGGCLVKMHRFDDAEAVLRECLALRQQKDPGDWWVFQTKSQLGQALTGRKRYAEAEALLLEAHQELTDRKEKIPGRYHRFLGEAAVALADLYEAWGKKHQAEQWREKKD